MVKWQSEGKSKKKKYKVARWKERAVELVNPWICETSNQWKETVKV